MIRYIGENEELEKMAERLDAAFKRPHIVATSQNPKKWPKCKKCKQPKMSIFEDTGLCYSCDSEEKTKK